MKLTQLPSEFQKALPILEKMKHAGFEAYFVGGSVRDAILNRPIHDVDIATSAYPEETKAIFLRTIDVGIEHGTVLVLEESGEYEVTTFRTEDVYVDYRRPSQVSFVRSLEEDLKRRDFTVNAFALAEDGQIIDAFQGLTDLDNRLLRAVGNPIERFNEDALRIMRGFRFSATLDFTIEPQTFSAMKKTAYLLEKISVERIFIEMDKLLTADFWQKGVHALQTSRAYEYLPALKGKGEELSLVLHRLRSDFVFSTSEQAWSMVIWTLNVRDVRHFLKRWKTSNDFQRVVLRLWEILRLRETREVTQYDCYVYGKEHLCLVEELRQAQGLSVDFDRIHQLYSQLVIHSKQDIVVNGGQLMRHCGIQPGPALGRLLQEIEVAIVEGKLANEETAIFAFATERGIR